MSSWCRPRAVSRSPLRLSAECWRVGARTSSPCCYPMRPPPRPFCELAAAAATEAANSLRAAPPAGAGLGHVGITFAESGQQRVEDVMREADLALNVAARQEGQKIVDLCAQAWRGRPRPW